MICTKCRKTVKVIAKFLDDQLSHALDIAHAITNEIAKAIDNPLFQLLVSQITFASGLPVDKVLAIIESELKFIDKAYVDCEGLTGVDRINCLLNALNIIPASERNSALLRIKSKLTAQLDGNRFKSFVYDTAAQLNYFNEQVKNNRNVNADGANAIIDIQSEPVANVAPVATVAPANPAAPLIPETTHAMPFNEGIILGTSADPF